MADLILLGGGIGGIAVAIVMVVAVLSRRDAEPTGVAGVLRSIETEYRARPGALAEPSRHDRLGAPLMRRLRTLAELLTPGGHLATLQRRLDVAGNPGSWTAERIMSYKGLGLIAVAAAGTLLGARSPVTAAVLAVAGAVVGFLLPDLLLHNAGLRRRAEIRRTLPDILDLLVVSVEAGLGFDAALTRVAQSTTGPLAAELARLLQEIRIGKSRRDALQAMAERISLEEARSFVAALVQATDLGIPIGKVLREQARELRIRRRQDAEERAQKVPVKIVFPVVLCIMPALLITVVGPGIIELLKSPLFH